MTTLKVTTINELIGKTFASVIKTANDENVLRFLMVDGSGYEFYHYQDCCESVCIEDVCGDLTDLAGSPMLIAEESTREATPEECCGESGTWTFYRFATVKGTVTVRWLGTSNGYYGESVDMREVKP